MAERLLSFDEEFQPQITNTLNTLVDHIQGKMDNAESSSVDEAENLLDDACNDCIKTFETKIEEIKTSARRARPDPSSPTYAEDNKKYAVYITAVATGIEQSKSLFDTVFERIRNIPEVHDDRNNRTIDFTQRAHFQTTATNVNRGIETNLVNGTITIVREKCKTLILKLRTPNRRYLVFGGLIKPEDDIDRIINELGDVLTQNVIEAINGIREEVKKARPNENDIDYQLKIQIYKDLLEYVTNLIKKLTKVFDESLTDYRIRVEQLWNNLEHTSDLNEINNYIEQFKNTSEQLFADAIQKHLDGYLNIIELKMNYMKQQNNLL
ncbi:unnamed protein product [Rotaria sordida]|uniref:Uncharacterized protein n=1 Tax=Rotaria sordida TaxID=392033 RepID=A0A818Z4M6_9BILA|nr:unnamed protein product [Rotaria sordida]CAF0898609.1 unnamed protein product [Rotaria sordida]CAF3765717.1 unnamed protein product [Rotaria sordida]CAF3931834.1 unnamed protein product [Rotaria sordida]